MTILSSTKAGFSLIIIVLLMLGLAGCYTMLNHPTVADEELVAEHDSELTGTSCTACHNNEYDHNRMSPHNWGFGSWGIRNYPYSYYSYYGSYGGWQKYYYDPWWWGWNYYNPYPPYYNPGGGSGSVGVSAPSPQRPGRGRDFSPAPYPQAPQYVPPPVYSAPANPNQGDNQQQNSGDSQDDHKRDGRGRG